MWSVWARNSQLVHSELRATLAFGIWGFLTQHSGDIRHIRAISAAGSAAAAAAAALEHVCKRVDKHCLKMPRARTGKKSGLWKGVLKCSAVFPVKLYDPKKQTKLDGW